MTTAVAAVALEALTTHLENWYHAPDIEALEIALAVAASHHTKADPVWLFVIGPPATGKTAIVIQALTLGQNCHMVSDLTPNTLLSGKERHGKADASLLTRIGSGIVLMKDFTTVLSKRAEERTAIAGQLREVYDGNYYKDTGLGAKVTWQGKITLIAACTPAIEREWMIQRDLGERFVSVKWTRDAGTKAAARSWKQNGQEQTLRLRTAQLGAEVLRNINGSRPDVSVSQLNQILALAEITALARNRVIRDTHGERQIIDLPQAEGSARLAKALGWIVTNYAVLQGREPADGDLRLARRVAQDSIPSNRMRILHTIPPTSAMRRAEIVRMSRIPSGSIDWHLDELEALELVVRADADREVRYTMTETLQELWLTAFPPGAYIT